MSGSHAYGALPQTSISSYETWRTRSVAYSAKRSATRPGRPASAAYEMVSTTIQSPKGEIETAYPVWESEPVALDLRAAMSAGTDRSGPPAEKTGRFAKWLLDHLRSDGHPVRLGDIFNAAGGLGYVGEYKVATDGNRWSRCAALFRARTPSRVLTGDDAGWMIDEMLVDDRRHWTATCTADLNHRITESPRVENATSPF